VKLPVVEGKMEATKSLLFFGVLTIAVWVGLGTAACWLIDQLYGWLFLGFSAFSILIVMRRQMCGSCYYCASCTKGFAKLSKLFVGGTRIPGLGRGSTLGMAVFIYVLLSVIPGAILVSSMLQEFSLIKLFLLIGLLAISIYNVAARGKNWGG
jgi:hypothetical protein